MLVKRTSQTGYTLVEIVLAMAVFSFVLLIIISSINGLYRIYRATEGIRDTQQQARTISEELTRAARGASNIVTGTQAVCFFYRANQADSNVVKTQSVMYEVEPAAPALPAVETAATLLTKKLVYKEWTDAQLTTATTCTGSDPNYTTNVRDVTTPDVAAVLFEPTAYSLDGAVNSLLTFHIRLASTRALASELESPIVAFDPANPDTTGPRCGDGESYCSMTSITSTVQARTKILEGQ